MKGKLKSLSLLYIAAALFQLCSAVSKLNIVDLIFSTKMVSEKNSISINLEAPSGYTNIDDVFYELHLPKKDPASNSTGPGFSINEDDFQCAYWIGFKESPNDDGGKGCTFDVVSNVITLGRSIDDSKDILAISINGLVNPQNTEPVDPFVIKMYEGSNLLSENSEDISFAVLPNSFGQVDVIRSMNDIGVSTWERRVENDFWIQISLNIISPMTQEDVLDIAIPTDELILYDEI